jgi:hypothetical protein
MYGRSRLSGYRRVGATAVAEYALIPGQPKKEEIACSQFAQGPIDTLLATHVQVVGELRVSTFDMSYTYRKTSILRRAGWPIRRKFEQTSLARMKDR